MPKIQKLSESLIAKIAAGEVIERPYSVVKELVENSIDAGAKNIEIGIAEGGRKEIRVADDGCGMGRDQALLAIERHATSKLHTEEDLFKIQTLGFRGEALPSIAAVSMMTLESSGRGEAANRIEVEGGKVLQIASSARNGGTTITVNNLFFNTPARLKFMKSRETEFSHIARWVEQVALSHPEIGFVLTHRTGDIGSARRELQTQGRAETRERIGDLFGPEIEKSLRPISFGRAGIELCGYLADHQVTSTTPRTLFFFVNGRIVRDRTLQHAVLQGYENLLMKHRYPWVFLYLTVSPDSVDVNVHPTKAEVRFANSQQVHELVRQSVRKSLSPSPSMVTKVSDSLSRPSAPSTMLRTGSLRAGQGERVLLPVEPSPSDGRGEIKPMLSSRVRVIGQVHSTYLVCEVPDKLVLIDQHAAHERIGFEKLKRQFEGGGIERQSLLIPKTFEVKPSEAEILKLYVEDLERFGFELEPFGRSSFVLRAVPALLSDRDCSGLIVDLIDSLQAEGKLEPLTERAHHVLETIACHRQVRAGDQLSTQEIEALLNQMGSTDFSYSCPHGRPSVLEVPFDEIEKWFKRRL
ncbi:MAG: DNA mismatch repair endonuclease MutL [Deltaproteobacteria bacterium]|nr:DNA mismatch repair endonuclease MutL [Deltaproteobacteria bacterium]